MCSSALRRSQLGSPFRWRGNWDSGQHAHACLSLGHETSQVSVLCRRGFSLPLACFLALFFFLRANPLWQANDFNERVLQQMRAAEEESEAIRENQLEPYAKRRIGALSEQELRQIVQAHKQIIVVLGHGVDVAKQTPAYRDQKVEEKRQKVIGLLDLKIANYERRTWQVIVNPALRDRIRLATLFFTTRPNRSLIAHLQAAKKNPLRRPKRVSMNKLPNLAALAICWTPLDRNRPTLDWKNLARKRRTILLSFSTY